MFLIVKLLHPCQIFLTAIIVLYKNDNQYHLAKEKAIPHKINLLIFHKYQIDI